MQNNLIKNHATKKTIRERPQCPAGRKGVISSDPAPVLGWVDTAGGRAQQGRHGCNVRAAGSTVSRLGERGRGRRRRQAVD
jgi:hypothetical protein